MTKRNALIDTIIKASKAKNAPRLTYSLTDGAGLSLEADHTPNAKGEPAANPYQWRFAFKSPVTGARSRLGFGAYPAVSIALAREKAQEARTLIAEGKDPARVRDDERTTLAAAAAAHVEAKARIAKGLAPLNSFRDVAEKLLAANANRWTASYAREYENTLAKYAHPLFGDKQISSFKPLDIVPLNEQLVAAGHRQTLVKLRRFVSHVFAFAMEPERSLCNGNPVVKQERLFDGLYKESRVAATTPNDARAIMAAIRGWQVSGKAGSLRNALLLSAWTFQRPNEIATARKEHFNLDAGTWVIPAVMMKGRKLKKEAPGAKAHTVFLATQAVAMLREQFALWPDSEWVFPNQGPKANQVRGHINRSSVGARLNQMGFKGKHCAHGFRAMARTIGEEVLELSPLVLEKTLAHSHAMARDGVTELNLDGGLGGAYARAQYLTKREDAAQVWADYLDQLTTPQLKLAA